MDLVVTRMSKHSSALLALESVEILVNEHVIIETVLARECRIADQTHKRLYAYNKENERSIKDLVPVLY